MVTNTNHTQGSVWRGRKSRHRGAACEQARLTRWFREDGAGSVLREQTLGWARADNETDAGGSRFSEQKVGRGVRVRWRCWRGLAGGALKRRGPGIWSGREDKARRDRGGGGEGSE